MDQHHQMANEMMLTSLKWHGVIFDRLLWVYHSSCFRRDLYPMLKAASRSSVVNIASVAGQTVIKSGNAYSMSKAGLIQVGGHRVPSRGSERRCGVKLKGRFWGGPEWGGVWNEKLDSALHFRWPSTLQWSGLMMAFASTPLHLGTLTPLWLPPCFPTRRNWRQWANLMPLCLGLTG